ncbi:MAG: diguanylate cyclase, partial [Pseudomonadales bacterium]|nr:diguanylate cyclase [Pseudomonadales bacterium]
MPFGFWLGSLSLAALYFGLGWSRNKVVASFFILLLLACAANAFSLVVLPENLVLGVVSLSCGLSIFLILILPPSINYFRQLINLEVLVKESLQHLTSMSQQAYEGIYLVDPVDFHYVDVNPSGAKALGYNREDLIQLSTDDVHPESNLLVRKKIREASQSNFNVTFQVWAQRKDGSKIYVELVLSHVQRAGRRFVLATGRDLTRWIRKNEQISQMNRLYAVLSQSNRAINQVRDEAVLMSRISDIATAEGAFIMAWVAGLEGSLVKPVVISGRDRGYVDTLKIDINDPGFVKAPVVRAFTEKKTICNNNFIAEPSFGPWRERAKERGFVSIAAIPIRRGDDVCYVLAVYSEQEDAFDQKMQSLLASLSDDLSNAIAHIEAEKNRGEIEKRLRQLSSAVDQSADAILIMSAEGQIEYVNPRFKAISGYDEADVIGLSPELLCDGVSEVERYRQVLSDLSGGRQYRGEFRYRRKNGETFWSKDVISPIRNSAGDIVQYVATFEDYTALREAQNKITQLAFYDSVTGLPNKRLVLDRIKQAVSNLLPDGLVAVLFLDMDKFKGVNDSLGHKAGDVMLTEVAHRLSGCVRQGDTVARIGADEFVLVLASVGHIGEVFHLVEDIAASIQEPVNIEETQLSLTCSIGVTLCPIDGSDPEDLVRKADMAMFHAKSSGRNNVQFFTEEMNAKALNILTLERKLRLAVQEQAFEVYYQPQVSLHTGQVTGVEALLRWPDENGGMISPADFIPVAEEAGLMAKLGAWALQRACSDAVKLYDRVGFSF